MAVVNRQREVSGVVTPSTVLLVNHEFNLPATRSAEMLMQEIMKYINEHGSPITVSTDRDSDEPEALHNILTQDIMSKEIRENLLEFEISCNSRYEMFRTERFITKQLSIFDTIHRRYLKTFKSMKVEKRTSQSKVKGSNKQLAETQKIFDIARV